jgi:hypothetical protein
MMPFLDRFRSPEAIQKRAEEQQIRDQERERRDIERREKMAAEQEKRLAAAYAEASRKAAADQEQQRQLAIEVLGADLVNAPADTPAEAKLAIKLARLRKKELQAEKRGLSAQLGDVREEWRRRTAGRYSTTLLGRGKTGRIIRAGVQTQRRGERLQHASQVNAFSDAKQLIDRKIDMVDRVIIELERKALG